MNVEQKRKYIEHIGKGWDADAQKYADRYAAVHFSIGNENTYHTLLNEILYYVDLSKDAAILEFGCGNGLFVEQFFKADYRNICGCDLSAGLIAQAKRAVPEVPFYVTDAANLRMFTDHQFDLVYTHGIFHYFPDDEYVQDVINEVYRVTKENGRIMILDILGSYWQQWYEQPTLKVQAKNLLKTWLGRIHRIQKYHYTDPNIFFETLREKKCKVYPLIEVINNKPLIFKQFRYNILIEKLG